VKASINSFLIFIYGYYFYTFYDLKEFTLLSEILFLLPTLFVYLFFYKKKSYTFFFISVFYSLGYPLYFAVLYSTFDKYNYGGWLAVGNFEFLYSKINAVVYSSILIITGLFLGIYFIILFSPFNRKIEKYNVNLTVLNKSVNYWFYIGLLLILLMYILGIGRTGLEDKIVLPFGLKAFLYYLRIISLPMIGMFFLQVAYDLSNVELLRKYFFKLLVISLLISLSSFSRSDIVLTLVPASIFLFKYPDSRFKGSLKKYFLFSILLIVITSQLVQLIRNFAYSSDGLESVSFSEIIGLFDMFSFNDVLDNLLSLLTIRQGGARDIGVVLNSQYNNIKYIGDYFFQINEEAFMFDVWNFMPDEFLVEGKTFGTGFNGLSWYAFGGNYLLIFSLSLITGMFIGFIERIFIINRFISIQIWISFFLALLFWNSFLWSKFSRIIPIILLSLFFIKKLKSIILKNEN
jgi:hypothetical protein